MQYINDFIIAAAGQPWVLVLVLACCTIDGFFPPHPERIVSGWSRGGARKQRLAQRVDAGLGGGAWSVCWGQHGLFNRQSIGIQRWRWIPHERMKNAFSWAGKELQRPAAPLIMVARFIPIGRVTVNLTVGATHFNRRRFVTLTGLFAIVTVGATQFNRRRFVTLNGLFAVVWASYSVVIGYFFGMWFKSNRLLGPSSRLWSP